ncbi:MAG TPA: 50S ribosomal protein L15 [Bryobacteraceae bacterium]|nr:50S ribosomal protein L15 [Bryobacteraceae bacterium]
MNLSNLKPPAGQKRAPKRIGRGMGSGRGKTATRGHKGQHAGTGFSLMRGFEGGQMPLHRRLPKRGFTNIFKKQYAVVNLGRLDKLEGDNFTPDRLIELGIVRKTRDGVKVLGSGELTRKIRVEAHLFSRSALDKIQKAGGEAAVIGAAAK